MSLLPAHQPLASASELKSPQGDSGQHRRRPFIETTTEKAMAPHSSTLAWKIPWTEEPGGLQSMGSLGVGPSPSHPSGSSQGTSPEHPVSCIEPGLAICFTYDNIHVSMLFSQIIPPLPSPTESKSLFFISVFLLLSHI